MRASDVSNPNLLINGDFRINQRGESTYSTTTAYTVDRWFMYGNGVYDVENKKLSNDSSSSVFFSQFIEDGRELLVGKTITLSISIDGVVYSTTGTLPTTLASTQYLQKEIITGVVIRIDNSTFETLACQVGMSTGVSAVIDYIKLELGEIATPFCPRPYAEELALCQRYYQKIDVLFQTVQYCSATNSLYTYDLHNIMRTLPTLCSYDIASIRSNFSNETLDTPSLISIESFSVSKDVKTVRISTMHSNTITAQQTLLYMTKVHLDAEIY